MNPIARMLQPTGSNEQSVINMAQGIKNGSVNAKEECLKIFNSLNKEQRRQIASAFPAFARRQGMSDSNINAFMQGLNV